jgi:hypothetical protein
MNKPAMAQPEVTMIEQKINRIAPSPILANSVTGI